MSASTQRSSQPCEALAFLLALLSGPHQCSVYFLSMCGWNEGNFLGLVPMREQLCAVYLECENWVVLVSDLCNYSPSLFTHTNICLVSLYI